MSATTPRRLDVARAARLNNALAIEQVLLFSLEARLLGPFNDTTAWGYTANFEPLLWVPRPDGLVAMFPLKVTVEDRRPSGVINVAEIVVGTKVFYKFAATAGLGEHSDALEDYLGIVGWMHAWPYARADMQNISTRMGLPPLVLPVLLAGQTSTVKVVRMDEAAPPPPVRKRSRAKK